MKLRSLIVLGALAVSALVYAVDRDNALIERIRPAGSLCLAGDECGSAAPVVASGPRDGKAVYDTSCFACHGAGVLGAPRLANAADWTDRLDKGFTTLVDHVVNGFGAMPAMGTCTSCSHEEIEGSVQYMLDTL